MQHVDQALQATGHRPWPLPNGEWKWRQSWLDLAFLHYRVSFETLRKWLPEGLTLQTYDGSAWVGLVPFRMQDVMRGRLPAFGPFRSFPELNLRTYVEADGKAGVWFFSLDADCLPIVLGGRRIYRLPYFRASMALERAQDWFHFRSTRQNGNVHFTAKYRPVGKVLPSPTGSFEHWATERYCLYSYANNGLRRVNVHHTPWPLQRAEVEIEKNEVISAAGIPTTDDTPICHFSTGVHVISYAAELVNRPRN